MRSNFEEARKTRDFSKLSLALIVEIMRNVSPSDSRFATTAAHYWAANSPRMLSSDGCWAEKDGRVLADARAQIEEQRRGHGVFAAALSSPSRPGPPPAHAVVLEPASCYPPELQLRGGGGGGSRTMLLPTLLPDHDAAAASGDRPRAAPAWSFGAHVRARGGDGAVPDRAADGAAATPAAGSAPMMHLYGAPGAAAKMMGHSRANQGIQNHAAAA